MQVLIFCIGISVIKSLIFKIKVAEMILRMKLLHFLAAKFKGFAVCDYYVHCARSHVGLGT